MVDASAVAAFRHILDRYRREAWFRRGGGWYAGTGSQCPPSLQHRAVPAEVLAAQDRYQAQLLRRYDQLRRERQEFTAAGLPRRLRAGEEELGRVFGYWGESFPSMADAPAVTPPLPPEEKLEQVTRERDEARARARDWERRYLANEAAAQLSELRRRALADVTALFTAEPGAGWARSVYVALEDLDGWRRLARKRDGS